MLQRAVELYSLKVLYYLCVSFILQWCSHFGYPLSFWRTNHVEGEIVCAYNEYNLHPRGLEMQFTKLNTTNNSLNIDLSVVKLFLWRLKKKKKKKPKELSHFPLLFTCLFGIGWWQLPEAWHFSREEKQGQSWKSLDLNSTLKFIVILGLTWKYGNGCRIWLDDSSSKTNSIS